MKHYLITSLAACAAVMCQPAHAAPNTATVSWGAVTKYSDDTPVPATATVTYNVYQGARGAVKPKVGTTGALTFAPTAGLVSGTEVCWQITAVAGGAESALSTEACKTFPQAATPAPTGVRVQ
jgi:hypothetical protein